MPLTRILIENIIVPYNGKMSGAHADSTALSSAGCKVSKALGVKCVSASVHRKSIDARKKTAVKLVYSVCADIELPVGKASLIKEAGFKPYTEAEFIHGIGDKVLADRPVVVGFGPAGMFCALALAEKGYAPIVFERGGDIFLTPSLIFSSVRAVRERFPTASSQQELTILFVHTCFLSFTSLAHPRIS